MMKLSGLINSFGFFWFMCDNIEVHRVIARVLSFYRKISKII